jgi:hypothetical protein
VVLIEIFPRRGGMKNPLDSLQSTVVLGFVLTVVVYVIFLSVG